MASTLSGLRVPSLLASQRHFVRVPAFSQVCSNCRPKLTCCPTCRGPLGSIRNLAMEKVANSVLFPCKYASSGCEVTLPHTDKTEHEELCEFRPYSCPCPGASCKWQGSLDAVMPHLMHQHKSITTLQVSLCLATEPIGHTVALLAMFSSCHASSIIKVQAS